MDARKRLGLVGRRAAAVCAANLQRCTASPSERLVSMLIGVLQFQRCAVKVWVHVLPVLPVDEAFGVVAHVDLFRAGQRPRHGLWTHVTVDCFCSGCPVVDMERSMQASWLDNHVGDTLFWLFVDKTLACLHTVLLATEVGLIIGRKWMTDSQAITGVDT